MTEDPALTFAAALSAGMIAQIIAVYLRIPGIVVLLISGVLLGPDVLGIVHPDQLGDGLDLLVELAVAIILFEGALNLNLERIRREATIIRRLITIGAVITLIGAAVCARVFIGWSWTLSFLFGTLVIVTGPTVITPLLRRMRVQRNLHTILEAEGVFIDPIGAIIAVVALEVVINSGALQLVGIPTRLLVGVVIGTIGGLFIGTALRRKLVPEELENVFTLSIVLALFEISNAVMPDSGIANTVVAGFVVGNMTTGRRTLREFKEQLTVMLVGLIFVLLAADVRLSQIQDLGWPALFAVLALMFIVRPIGVAVSTARSGLSWNEKAFISWIGPRGIVAAGIASLFAVRLEEAGFEGGPELRALVFSVIALTVVIQGITGGWIALKLGVRRPKDNGYVIIGANALGRAVAESLSDGGEDIVVIDSNPAEVKNSSDAGLNAFHGNAHDDNVLIRADVEGRRGFITVTTNEGVNLLLARKAREEYKVPTAFAALYRGKPGVGSDQVVAAGASLLFGRPANLQYWIRSLEIGDAELVKLRYGGDQPYSLDDIGPGPLEEAILPLTVERNEAVRPAGGDPRINNGDIVTFACVQEHCESQLKELRSRGWTRIGEDALVVP